MDNDSPETGSKTEAAQEEEKRWNEIISKYADEDKLNLIWSFSIFGKTVRTITEQYQSGMEGVNPDGLNGLWNMFLSLRKRTVEAYKFYDSDPELFIKKIRNLGMDHITSISRALNFFEKDEYLHTRLDTEKNWSTIALEDEFGIKTEIPRLGEKPDISWQEITHGSGEKISQILQPGFIDKSTGTVIREAMVETDI